MSEYLGIDMRRLYLLLFFFSFSGILFGATTYTSTTTGGDWSVGSTWVGGSVPGTNNTTITIDGSVYSTTSLTFNSNVDLTVNSNDTLIINGDLSLNSNNTFTIQTGAVVIVRGNFTSNSNLNIAADAYFIITGNVISQKKVHMVERGSSYYHKTDKKNQTGDCQPVLFP